MQFISNRTAAAQKGRGGQKTEGGEERGARRVAECKYDLEYSFPLILYIFNCLFFRLLLDNFSLIKKLFRVMYHNSNNINATHLNSLLNLNSELNILSSKYSLVFSLV